MGKAEAEITVTQLQSRSVLELAALLKQLPGLGQFPDLTDLVIDKVEKGGSGTADLFETPGNSVLNDIDFNQPGLNNFDFDLEALATDSDFMLQFLRQSQATVDVNQLLEFFKTLDHLGKINDLDQLDWLDRIEAWDPKLDAHLAFENSLIRLKESGVELNPFNEKMVLDQLKQIRLDANEGHNVNKVYFKLKDLIQKESVDFSVLLSIRYHYRRNLFRSSFENSEANWIHYINARLLDTLANEINSGKNPLDDKDDFRLFLKKSEKLFYIENMIINSLMFERSQKIFKKISSKGECSQDDMLELAQEAEADYLNKFACSGLPLTKSVSECWQNIQT